MNEMKEWTLMFYFACDNTLAPVIISQLKAIKDAGFHENIDVLVYFDPNEMGVPTRVYDVNQKRKKNPRLPNTMIGDGVDPFVRNMKEDDIKKMDAASGSGTEALNRVLRHPDDINAEDALTNFLNFCQRDHQAKRYMLFVVGHGMVVGNDAFLSDDNPISAITLKKLGEILKDFNKKIKGQKEQGVLELLSLHSCSMSAIEVAYELKGTANYMIASEGPSFVGSFPYRQLLKKVFNSLAKAKEAARQEAKRKRANQARAESNPSIDIQELVEDLYFQTLLNATDFMLAGYSHDLALCSLDPQKFDPLTDSMKELVGILVGGLKASRGKDGSEDAERGKRIKELVLLAHWEAQSYWGESYTDLFDFCRCLRERCDPNGKLKDVYLACGKVMEKLQTIKSKDRSERFEALVIRSDNFGSESQYSHGLSIYFPWSRPIEILPKKGKYARTNAREKYKNEKYEDEEKGVLERYKEYAFTGDLGSNSWSDFLETYFDETKRRSRKEEDGASATIKPKAISAAFQAAKDGYNPLGSLARVPNNYLSYLLADPKPNGRVGEGCTCPTIKNYPQENYTDKKQTKKAPGKTITNADAFAISQEALKAFKR